MGKIMRVRLTMMGRSYDATTQLPDELEVGGEGKIGDALEAVAAVLPDSQELPASCLVVHNGKHVGTVASHDNAPLAERDELVLIAPVAGG